MTANIPQTSASERIEEARAAIAAWEPYDQRGTVPNSMAFRIVAALRALITPPAVGESEVAIAAGIHTRYLRGEFDEKARFAGDAMRNALLAAVREAIQSAHESWEPADVPSQEFMLRHLDIEYTAGTLDDTILYIHAQHINLEVI